MAKATKNISDDSLLNEEDMIVITKEGLKSLEEELNELKTVRRKQVAGRLKEAISFGDLSENSEYEEAKNEQAFVEGRIIEVEIMIKRAKVIDEKHHSKSIVEIGTKVKIRNTQRKTEEFEWTIVGSTESDPFNGRISNEAPVGMSLMGAKVGDKVIVKTPGGEDEYEVLKLA
jgi:transcription elongation factor GreA